MQLWNCLKLKEICKNYLNIMKDIPCTMCTGGDFYVKAKKF